ncbi:MAG: pyridoxal phosphate-dependent aminotransferase, partial [Myxococcales bacterium]|nr:pyridoxal phosphate-dependent aminotransferase [Myxococcales bacterium]
MRLSQLAQAVQPSATLHLNEEAQRLRAQGASVVHLGTGEPRIKTPIDAVRAASAKLTSAELKYTGTSGTPALKSAVAQYMGENYGADVLPSQIVISPGAKASLYMALLATIDPGDEVIITAPYWVSYPEMIKAVRGQPVVVETGEDFEPRLADIERAITQKTRAIIVNSPNNPSGAVYGEALIAGLVELCEARDIFLIVDDIYQRLVFGGQRACSPYMFVKQDRTHSKLILINGISKLYGMTGFRIGWTVSAPALASAMGTLQGQSVSCPSALLQDAALGAMRGQQAVLDGLLTTLEHNRGVLCEGLKAIPGVKLHVPAGTFYTLADFSAIEPSSEKLSKMLLDKALVVTVPGKEFGREGHLRISFCGALEEICRGVERLRWALDLNAPREIWLGDQRAVRDW